jgi:hypothetical protein
MATLSGAFDYAGPRFNLNMSRASDAANKLFRQPRFFGGLNRMPAAPDNMPG